jgi:hypothetical protein
LERAALSTYSVLSVIWKNKSLAVRGWGWRFHDELVSSDILEKVVYIVYQFVVTIQLWVKLSPLRLKQLVTSRNWGEYLNKHKTQGHEAQRCVRNLQPTGAVTEIRFADYTGYIVSRNVSFHIIAYCVE